MQNVLNTARPVLENFVSRGYIPGAALAAVTPHGAQWAHVGFSSLLPEKRPLQPDALYDLASLTKVVATTTAALQCIEKGYFSLQTPLRSILPDFPHAEVTVGHLMAHTSGICSDDKNYKNFQGKAAIRDFFIKKPLEFAPGTQVEYSDFGYIALGFAIESFVGDLDGYTHRHIFAPLQMEDTGYLPAGRGLAGRCVPTEETPDRGLVQGEVHDGKAFRLGGVSGHAGLFSTVQDLARFVRMMLQGGALDGARVLAPASVALLKKCYTGNLAVRRTLGWLVNEPTNAFGDYASDVCLFHTGFTGTCLYIDYVRGCGVVLLTNRVHPGRDNPHIQQVRNIVHNQVLLAIDDAAGA